jgi:hypothetical protein
MMRMGDESGGPESKRVVVESIKQRFTNDEWAAVRNGPMLAGMGAAALDTSLEAFARQVAALTMTLEAAVGRYDHDALVTTLLYEVGTAEESRDREDLSLDMTVERLEQAVAAVREKAPEHERCYRTLLREVAQIAARASGPPILEGSAALTDPQARFLARFKSVLGSDD